MDYSIYRYRYLQLIKTNNEEHITKENLPELHNDGKRNLQTVGTE